MKNKAEDAGGLTPIKDDNEVIRKFRRKANVSFWLSKVLVTHSRYLDLRYESMREGKLWGKIS